MPLTTMNTLVCDWLSTLRIHSICTTLCFNPNMTNIYCSETIASGPSDSELKLVLHLSFSFLSFLQILQFSGLNSEFRQMKLCFIYRWAPRFMDLVTRDIIFGYRSPKNLRKPYFLWNCIPQSPWISLMWMLWINGKVIGFRRHPAGRLRLAEVSNVSKGLLEASESHFQFPNQTKNSIDLNIHGLLQNWSTIALEIQTLSHLNFLK